MQAVYLLNLQKEIEKSTISNKLFGYVIKYGYLCAHFFYVILKYLCVCKPPCEVSACYFFVHY